MEQTNRTILFERVNPTKAGILSLISLDERKESLSDEDIKKIHTYLQVDSFQEFVEKFSPTVNMVLDTDNFTVEFSKEDLGINQTMINLRADTSLFNTLMEMIEIKKNKKYASKGFNNLAEKFINKKSVKTFEKDRSVIVNKVITGSEEKEKIKKYAINTIKEYDEGMFLVSAFIEETYYLFESGNKKPSIQGLLDFTEQMQVKVIKKSNIYESGRLLYNELELKQYNDFMTECFEELEDHDLKNKKLLKLCFLLPVMFSQKQYFEIYNYYKKYANLNKNIVKRFWTTVKPVIQVMLGVKHFFDQHDVSGGQKPKLVVANFSVSEIKDVRNKEKLDIYLNSVNSKVFYENTLWYAIIPNVSIESSQSHREIRERFKSNKEDLVFEKNNIEDVCYILDIVSQYKIQSFVSFAMTDKSTFTTLEKKGIEVLESSLEHFNNISQKELLIPCYPNFTLVSSRDACVNVGRNIEYNEDDNEIKLYGYKELWLDEIGIEASYVAAGIVGACQCNEYLKSKFNNKVSSSNPGIAFRFSQGNNNIVTLDLLSETMDISSERKEEILAKSRGIIFVQEDGKMKMFTDRVYSYTKENGLLISMVQTLSYIERTIQRETHDYKKNLIIQFFQNRPGSLLSKWKDSASVYVNPILRANEYIEYKIDDNDDTCTFSVMLENSDIVMKNTVNIRNE